MKKALVAYFSATGVTENVAGQLARAIKAELFEIVPQQPYSRADINWRDEQSRSTLEMKDRSSRPAIASHVENMAQYDIIFVGFPVWWYREPSIIDTFLEEYDFTGKTVVPFVTSGGSDAAEATASIRALLPEVNVGEGHRFRSRPNDGELGEWAREWLQD